MVEFPFEKSSEGRGRLTLAMSRFSAFVDSCNLIDPYSEGALFTWSNHTEVPTFVLNW